MHSHSQAISPNTVLYQHSPSESVEYHSHQQAESDQSHHHQHQLVSHHAQHQSSHESKYSENVNGHDTLTDFVTFVCQEAENSPQSSQVQFIRPNIPSSTFCPNQCCACRSVSVHYSNSIESQTLFTVQLNVATTTTTTDGTTCSNNPLNGRSRYLYVVLSTNLLA